MTAGLIVSIMGTRLIEGGSDGSVALGVLPLIWVAALTTFGELLSFASPLMARWAGRYSPAKVLVWSDFAEAMLSAAALLLILVLPESTVPVLVVYLLAAAIFPALTDVVEEFYGQQLAQADVDQAMTFNATIYSVLAFVGIVLAMPLGSLVAGLSIALLIALNAVLSLGGTAFRLVSARTVVTPPVSEQDIDDFGGLGERMRLRDFVRDLFATGPASPVVGLVTQIGATAAGIFVYLWIASRMPLDPAAGLALVIASFGLGATAGPWIGQRLHKRIPLTRALESVYTVTIAGLILLAVTLPILPDPAAWLVGLLFALGIGIASRARGVLTVTLRQQDFRGERFSRVMSWSFALTALGAIIGSWLGVALRIDQHPSIGLGLLAAALVFGLVTTRRYTPGPVHTQRG